MMARRLSWPLNVGDSSLQHACHIKVLWEMSIAAQTGEFF